VQNPIRFQFYGEAECLTQAVSWRFKFPSQEVTIFGEVENAVLILYGTLKSLPNVTSKDFGQDLKLDVPNQPSNEIDISNYFRFTVWPDLSSEYLRPRFLAIAKDKLKDNERGLVLSELNDGTFERIGLYAIELASLVKWESPVNRVVEIV
jgi:hypothetical protein